MVTRGKFANDLLTRLGAPRTRRNRQALVAWMQTEGYGGKNNPLNTTMKMPGSTTFNTHGVQNYTTIEQGNEAAYRTLTQSDERYGYGKIISSLRNNRRPRRTLQALIDSSWGTTDLVLEVLEDVQRTWPDMAAKPAAN